jgi:hypothetical protein
MICWWIDTARSAGFAALFPGELTYFYTECGVVRGTAAAVLLSTMLSENAGAAYRNQVGLP